MRILIIHSYYGSSAPSGENQVFEAERQLLLGSGHEVITFTRHSDEWRRQGVWGIVKGALATPWNPWMFHAVRNLVHKYKPDVVHVHNTFPRFSPAIFHAIGSSTARVLTLHNYRLFCPAAIPVRAGQICTECLDRHSVWPALQYGCYRNNRLATMPLAASVALHKFLRTWTHHVDAFIALTEFQRQRMIGAGLPADRISVKPNFFPDSPNTVPWSARKPYAVFAGRLTAEKGVDVLVRAWLQWGSQAPELRIIGDGVLRNDLQTLANAQPDVPIHFLGLLTQDEAQAEISSAKLLIVPSIWFEGFPMVVGEAFAFATPIAVSDIGPLPSIVTNGVNGLVFSPADPCSLLNCVRDAWEVPGLFEQLSKNAREEFQMRYTQDKNIDILMKIYTKAISTARGSNC